ncbi:MAG: hypothetical protein Q4F49_06490 [Pseudoxanthomonas suwonensis]|nr:hypothetical protein [Pseudoxanthomonas suwonensis]
MSTHEQLKDDLDYVAAAVRRSEPTSGGLPLVYLFWAIAIGIGFALPDFAPRLAGWYWMVVGIGGGVGTMLYANHVERRGGVDNTKNGRLWGLHFGIGGLGWMGVVLQMLSGRIPPEAGAPSFLLVTGLVYALAGVHLDRPMLWSGLLALAGFALMQLLPMPYLWTTTGVLMALSLGLAALLTARQ